MMRVSRFEVNIFAVINVSQSNDDKCQCLWQNLGAVKYF